MEKIKFLMNSIVEMANMLPTSEADFGLEVLLVTLIDELRVLNGSIPEKSMRVLMGVAAGLMVHSNEGAAPDKVEKALFDKIRKGE